MEKNIPGRGNISYRGPVVGSAFRFRRAVQRIREQRRVRRWGWQQIVMSFKSHCDIGAYSEWHGKLLGLRRTERIWFMFQPGQKSGWEESRSEETSWAPAMIQIRQSEEPVGSGCCEKGLHSGSVLKVTADRICWQICCGEWKTQKRQGWH